VGQVREVLRAARESVLDLCGDGRPSVLAEHGLAGALQRAAALGSRAGLAVDVQVAADLGPLPPDVEAATYFCCVEALQNVAKHASATSVSVVVQRVGRELGLSVSDNGVGLPSGFDWRQPSSLGLRLVQMLSKQIDAEVEVHQEEGTEFAVILQVDRLED